VLETYDSPLDMTAMAVTYGVMPTGLEDFVRAFVLTATSSGRSGA
jgi:hypothetical protein